MVILPEITVRPLMPNKDSLELFARLVYAEANREPCDCQVAVLNTVISRSHRKNKNYSQIIYQKGQYDGVKTKYFHRKPTVEHYRAAYLALIGRKIIPDGVQYFMNEDIATDLRWKTKLQKHKYFKCGNHTFYWVPRLKPRV